MKIEKLTYPMPPEYLKEVFKKSTAEFDLQFGTVFLEKGTRIPEKDWTRHDQTKIVYIVSGKTHLFIEKDPDFKQLVQSGDSFMVEKNEAHRGEVIADTQLIFVLFGKKELE
tara:strand:- start:309905 stop:310240 length:336 start_codon:yes stop_codon:yes gene_type:complete